MAFYQILQEIMNEKGMSIPAVARACGLSDGTVRSIIKRQQDGVALEVAFKLSDGLGVSLERLNGMDEPAPQTKKAPSMSDEAKELLPLFESLDQLDRVRVIGTVTGLLMGEKYQQDIEISKNA